MTGRQLSRAIYPRPPLRSDTILQMDQPPGRAPEAPPFSATSKACSRTQVDASLPARFAAALIAARSRSVKHTRRMSVRLSLASFGGRPAFMDKK